MVTPCADCAIGKYQSQNVAASYNCKTCVAGKYTNLTKQSGCQSCVEGKYSVGTGNALCADCAAGKYGDPGVGQKTVCKDCSLGKYNNFKGQLIVSCKSCIVGQYTSSVGSSLCTPCGPGKFTNADPGQVFQTAACKVCDKGQYSNDTGAPQCKLCPMGKNLVEEGTAAEHDHFSDCSNCPKQQVSLICCPLLYLW